MALSGLFASPQMANSMELVARMEPSSCGKPAGTLTGCGGETLKLDNCDSVQN
jgi:hypothetical protein